MIRAWLARRKQERDEKAHSDGYNYAAGQLLLQSDLVLDKLRAEAHNPFEVNQFDKGMEAAISDYEDKMGMWP